MSVPRKTALFAAVLLLIGFFSGLILRCQPMEVAHLAPCPDGGAVYELAFLGDSVEPIWSGPIAEPECRLIPLDRSRQVAARCDGGEWVVAVRQPFDVASVCDGS